MRKLLLGLSVTVMLLVWVPLQAEDSALGRALGLYYAGDYQSAVDAFKQVLDGDPENAAAYYYLGYTYQEMGNYIAARMAFKKTYEVNPDYVPHVPGQR